MCYLTKLCAWLEETECCEERKKNKAGEMVSEVWGQREDMIYLDQGRTHGRIASFRKQKQKTGCPIKCKFEINDE